jgi:hypothetical protein
MKSKADRVRWHGCLFAILVLGEVILMAGAYLWFYMDHTGPTLVRGTHQAASLAKSPYTLSSEQQQLVDEIGYPESFTLLFYQEQGEGDRVYDIRFECWHYGAAGREIVFVNGEETSDESVTMQTEALSSTPYRPEQFAASMRLKDVLGSIGVSTYAHAAADPGLVREGETYFASHIAFALQAGRLMAVETVPLEAEG